MGTKEAMLAELLLFILRALSKEQITDADLDLADLKWQEAKRKFHETQNPNEN